jgi:hypothetical protein
MDPRGVGGVRQMPPRHRRPGAGGVDTLVDAAPPARGTDWRTMHAVIDG